MIRRWATLVFMLPAAVLSTSVRAQDSLSARGEYVLRAAGCVSCHTERDGDFLAGGRAFESPFGVFYSPNITSDPEHGLGGWTPDEFIRAFRHGESPDGEHYYPVFPYPTYTLIRDEDLKALHTYLSQTPPIATPSRPHELPWYLRSRVVNWFWKLLFFETGPFQPDDRRPQSWNRGAYLATALAHCDECHTPRNQFGALDMARRMAGAALAGDDSAPNISPDRFRGIGNWAQADLVRYLHKGIRPDGDYADGAMWELIDDGLAHLPTADIEAIVEYIMSLPPQSD